MKLKPWQENERAWLSDLVKVTGDVRRLSKLTGWTLPTVRAKLLGYDLARQNGHRTRLKVATQMKEE
jgi:hypothetical protein